MKNKIKYFILVISLLVFPKIVLAADKVSCGNVTGIPKKIPELTSLFVTTAQVATAVILVILGSIDLFKGIASSKEEEIKKGQQTFVKRLIVAALVFFVVLIVKMLVGAIANSTTTNNIVSCMDCFLSNGCVTDASSSNTATTKQSNISQDAKTFLAGQKLSELFSKIFVASSNSSSNKSNNSNSSSSKNKTSKKANTVFVGDSRTVLMCDSYKLCENNEYIAKVSMGYDWFVSTAIPQVNSKIKSKEYNIVILMGVNGVGKTSSEGKSHAEKYFNKISSLAKNDWKKQRIIYVSINPVVDGKSYSYMAAVNSFNSTMKSKISSSKLSNMSYCDTISKVKMSEIDSGDGLHYNKTGNSKIYNIIKNNCI